MLTTNGNGRLRVKPMKSLPHEQSEESLTERFVQEVMLTARTGDVDALRRLLLPLLPKEGGEPAPIVCDPDKPVALFKGSIGELWAQEGDPTQLVLRATNASLKQFRIVARKINQIMRAGKHFTDRHGVTKPIDEMPLEDAVEEIKKTVLFEMRAQVNVEPIILGPDDK
jgi:hypothetical protein